MSGANASAIDYSNFSLDDLPDLPEFVTFPTGAYFVNIVEGIQFKTIGDHPAYTAKLTLVEIAEIEEGALDDGEAPPKAGDSCDVVFMVDNEFGQGALKKFLAPIAAAMGTRDIKSILKQSKGLKLAVLGTRSKPDAKDRRFFRPTAVEVQS